MKSVPSIPIAYAMLGHYISSVVELVMLKEPDYIMHPQSISEKIFKVRRTSAVYHGDWDALKLGVEYILNTPDFDASTIVLDSEWEWEDEEIRSILMEFRRRLWSQDPPDPARVKAVEITHESIKQWRDRQSHQSM